MLICLNLDMEKRNDAIAVDARLNPPGRVMRNLLQEDDATYTIEAAPDGTAYVRVPLQSHEMAILKPL
jgi:hypothetical protein